MSYSNLSIAERRTLPHHDVTATVDIIEGPTYHDTIIAPPTFLHGKHGRDLCSLNRIWSEDVAVDQLIEVLHIVVMVMIASQLPW